MVLSWYVASSLLLDSAFGRHILPVGRFRSSDMTLCVAMVSRALPVRVALKRVARAGPPATNDPPCTCTGASCVESGNRRR